MFLKVEISLSYVFMFFSLKTILALSPPTSLCIYVFSFNREQLIKLKKTGLLWFVYFHIYSSVATSTSGYKNVVPDAAS